VETGRGARHASINVAFHLCSLIGVLVLSVIEWPQEERMGSIPRPLSKGCWLWREVCNGGTCKTYFGPYFQVLGFSVSWRSNIVQVKESSEMIIAFVDSC
jgi:hypothetical protein